MYASKGALDHHTIMNLSWRQFQVYMDSFRWLMNEQSEEGKRDNMKYDLEAMRKMPGAKERKAEMLAEAKKKLKGLKKRKKP